MHSLEGQPSQQINHLLGSEVYPNHPTILGKIREAGGCVGNSDPNTPTLTFTIPPGSDRVLGQKRRTYHHHHHRRRQPKADHHQLRTLLTFDIRD